MPLLHITPNPPHPLYGSSVAKRGERDQKTKNWVKERSNLAIRCPIYNPNATPSNEPESSIRNTFPLHYPFLSTASHSALSPLTTHFPFKKLGGCKIPPSPTSSSPTTSPSISTILVFVPFCVWYNLTSTFSL